MRNVTYLEPFEGTLEQIIANRQPCKLSNNQLINLLIEFYNEFVSKAVDKERNWRADWAYCLYTSMIVLVKSREPNQCYSFKLVPFA